MPPAERSVLFATCAPGVEPVLHAETRALGLARTERQVGGVRFEGTRADVWTACARLRTAVRVLLRVARFEARDADALHAGAAEVPWERWLAPDGSLAVQAQSSASALEHSLFLEQRVKDAVVDRFRAHSGTRPRVDKDDPDLRIHLHLFRDRATLALDASGEALHRRGWRRHQGRAPLAENLAAALLAFSGWDARAPLVDPFCGSGTIAIEGAWIAAGIAPGSLRTFGFERWRDHDARAYAGWRAGLVPEPRTRRAPAILGSDVDPERVREARENAEAAGVAEQVRFEVADARMLALKPGWNACVASNLPYGLRVGAEPDVVPLLAELGARLRAVGRGSSLALLAGAPAHVRALGLRGLRRVPLVNGGLECVLALGTV